MRFEDDRREHFSRRVAVPPNSSRDPRQVPHLGKQSEGFADSRRRRPRILPGDAENLVEKKCVLVLVRSPLRDVTRGYVARGAMRSVAPAQRADVAAARIAEARVDAAARGRRRFPERSRDASRKQNGERVPSEASARRARRAEGARVPARHATRARAPRSAPRRDFRSEVRLASRRRRARPSRGGCRGDENATRRERGASRGRHRDARRLAAGRDAGPRGRRRALDVRHRARFGRGARAARAVVARARGGRARGAGRRARHGGVRDPEREHAGGPAAPRWTRWKPPGASGTRSRASAPRVADARRALGAVWRRGRGANETHLRGARGAVPRGGDDDG